MLISFNDNKSSVFDKDSFVQRTLIHYKLVNLILFFFVPIIQGGEWGE